MYFRYICYLEFCITCLVFLTSCGSDNVSDQKNVLSIDLQNDIISKLTNLSDRIDSIEKKIIDIDEEIFLCKIDSVKFDDFFKFESETNDTLYKIKDCIIQEKIVFNLKENKGYSRIMSGGHIFYVSFEDIQPYLDGFKVFFIIGNPFLSTFNNTKICVKWSTSPWKYYKDNNIKITTLSEMHDLWEKSRKMTQTTFLEGLKPGTWNRVEIILTPATLDEIEYVEFSMDISTVSLKND